MLDLSDTETTDVTSKFVAKDHFIYFCDGGKIKVEDGATIHYGQGWCPIIENLLDIIKPLPIRILQVTDFYGQLDTYFDVFRRTRECAVWRALAAAREESRHTCMECGFKAKRSITGGRVVVACLACFREVEKKGDTGTWLDKF